MQLYNPKIKEPGIRNSLKDICCFDFLYLGRVKLEEVNAVLLIYSSATIQKRDF